MKKKFPLKTIVISLSVLWHAPSVWAAEASEYSPMKAELNTVVVEGSRKDARGYNRVYSRDAVNLYKGKQEIETYKGTSVADLLQGMSGVYSGEARNSGAVDPNIRGVQGEGRIPVTIDGTEQAITVWRGYAGMNNRNYVDPNIISSISVEKGPAFNNNFKTGIGGGVAMKTLEVDDIVEPGKKWGVEVKTEFGNNAIKPLPNRYLESRHYLDYNSVMGLGGTWRSAFDGTELRDQRFHGKDRFNQDKAFRIAAATKQDNFEGLLAYAYRSRGNYFSGKKGAGRYDYQEGLTLENMKDRVPETIDVNDPYIARIGLFVKPGSEISNTSLETTSYLAKTGFKPTENSKINLGYRYTRSYFGDIMPTRIFGPMLDSARRGKLYQSIDWPLAEVKQNALNLDWQWKPESRFVNLNGGAWLTNTASTTNTSGGWPGDIYYYESELSLPYFNKIAYNECINGSSEWCGYSETPITSKEQAHKVFMENNPDFDPSKNYSSADAKYPNIDGRFNSVQGQAYHSKNNRYGFHLSNTMKLHDTLQLSMYGMLQRETLNSHTAYDSVLDPATRKILPGEEDKVAVNELFDFAALPRSGKRREGSFAFNFRYTPVPWLELNAGARYSSYSIQDDNAYNFQEVQNTRPYYIDRGVYYSASVVPNAEQYALYKSGVEKLSRQLQEEYPGETYTPESYSTERAYRAYLNQGLTQAENNAVQMIEIDESSGQAVPYIKWVIDWFSYRSPSISFTDLSRYGEYLKQLESNPDAQEPVTDINFADYSNAVFFWARDKHGRLHLKDNPLTNGSIKDLNEKVANPADPNGALVDKYRRDSIGWVWHEARATDKHTREELDRARKQKNAGWTPSFSATIHFTDHARLYARYHEFMRWPSMFEGTRGFSSGGDLYGQGATSWYGYQWKPEHAKIFEVGYVHDLTGLLPKARYADLRLGYYRNKTENIIDRDELYNLIQFDKQIRDGVELQARYDSGRIFGDIGVTRSLRNQVCDAAYAYWTMGPNRESLPECLSGSMSENSYLATMIQPRWSVTANLGARFFNEKLTLGSRFTYHSRAYNTRTSDLIKQGWEVGEGAENYTVRWQPVAVVDAYVRYKFNKHLSGEITGSNLTNRYYLDPMSRSYMPAPGRTIRMSLTGKW